MILAILTFGLSALLICIEFTYVLSYSRSLLPPLLFKTMELLYIIILPILFLSTTESINDCCSDSAFFSPDHRLTLYVIIALCMLSYIYSSWRNELSAPLMELIINCLLLIAVVLNIFIALQHIEKELAFIIHCPIILLYIIAIAKNQILFFAESGLSETDMKSPLQKLAWEILNLNLLKRIPLLILLCFPLLTILSVLLLLLGQKPDSAVRAFTETYKHGFSQLDDQCINAMCPGGHFLCTIAAKGHKNLVNPVRLGRRGTNIIVCNRQLLISNAFEELLQQKLPYIHKPVRRFYNQIGNLIHRYYGGFNCKWVSDSVYIAMKPLEYFFLIVLYLFDKKPENRIATQYIDKNEGPNLIKHITNA
jgi:hypothetical protein